jgi:hypothetical protein
MSKAARTRDQVKAHLNAVKIDVPPKPFAEMTIDELGEYEVHCRMVMESARKVLNNAQAEFNRCCKQVTFIQNLHYKRVAALKMDPNDRLIALVEDLMKRGSNLLADHVAANWAEDDGVVVVIGLEEFDEDARSSLVTSAENCGVHWRGW